jgi:hypothetical protein
MHRLALIAAVLTACTSPNREHDDPEAMCASDPPPIHDVFRINDAGAPKGWIGWIDGEQVHWTQYANGDPYAVSMGGNRVKCYPGGLPAEVCVGDPSEGCDCYLPSGEDAECETAWQVLDGYYKADVRAEGADSAR